MTHTPTITFKRGDNFKLDITVTDPSNDTAEAAQVILTAAQQVYDRALVADPFVQGDVDTALAALIAAQDAYDLTIIVDITNWTITSKMTWCGTVVQIMEITITNASLGTFNIRAYEIDTILWPIRKHNLDILFTRDPEGGTSSETMIVDVLRGATNG